MQDTPSLLANCSPLVRPMVAVQALWAFMGPFGDYILSSFLLREKEYFTVAVGLQTFVSNVKNLKIAYFSAGAILIALPNLYSLLLPTKELCFRTYKWWRQGIIYPRHPFSF